MEISIVEKCFGTVVEIEETISLFAMAKTMGEDYGLIMNYLKESGEQEEGIPYSRYLDIDWEEEVSKPKWKMFLEIFTKKWHFCAGIPTTVEVSAKGKMSVNQFPVMKCVKAVHEGPYPKVGETYTAMVNWAKEHGIQLEPTSFECYLNSPKEVSASELKTEVYIPVKE